jgi:hypothetical protein
VGGGGGRARAGLYKVAHDSNLDMGGLHLRESMRESSTCIRCLTSA